MLPLYSQGELMVYYLKLWNRLLLLYCGIGILTPCIKRCERAIHKGNASDYLGLQKPPADFETSHMTPVID